VSRISWWAVVSAVAGPLLLVGGWTIAAAQQPHGYNPIRDTISSLAAEGATDRWIMTTALAGLGACYLITSAGLPRARSAGRVVLACGGLATLLVATFPQPVVGNSVAHTAAAAVAFTSLAVWPVFAACRRPCAPLLTRFATTSATVFMAGLVLWFVLEVHGGHRGLAERAAAGMEALWPLAVVVSSLTTTADRR
jgi:hypothetical membrane protein